MEQNKEIVDGLILELKRGTAVLGVLSQLKEPLYGYSLVNILKEKDMDIDKNTLYPLLRRLEKQELLTSKWDTEESRPRKYYELSQKGMEVLNILKDEWQKLNKVVGNLLGE